MAECELCNREMTTAASCTVDVLIMRNERFERDRVVRPVGRDGRCGDCGVQAGGLHHLGCDLERCPRCRRQWVSCGCSWLDEETESLVAVADGVVVHPDGLRGLEMSDERFPFDLSGEEDVAAGT